MTVGLTLVAGAASTGAAAAAVSDRARAMLLMAFMVNPFSWFDCLRLDSVLLICFAAPDALVRLAHCLLPCYVFFARLSRSASSCCFSATTSCSEHPEAH